VYFSCLPCGSYRNLPKQAAARRFLAVAKTERAIAFSAQGVGTAGARLAQRWVKLLQSLRAHAYAQRRSNAAALRRSAGGPSTLYAALHRREDSSLTITPPRSSGSKRRSPTKSGSRNRNTNFNNDSGGLSSPTGAEHAFSRDNSFAEDVSREDDRSSSVGSGEDDDRRSEAHRPRNASSSGNRSAEGGSNGVNENSQSDGHSPSHSAGSGGSGISVNSTSSSEGSGGTPRRRSGASASGSASARSSQAPMSPEARAVTLEGTLKDREVHIAMLTR
jgi:hypothetical protein